MSTIATPRPSTSAPARPLQDLHLNNHPTDNAPEAQSSSGCSSVSKLSPYTTPIALSSTMSTSTGPSSNGSGSSIHNNDFKAASPIHKSVASTGIHRINLHANNYNYGNNHHTAAQSHTNHNRSHNLQHHHHHGKSYRPFAGTVTFTLKIMFLLALLNAFYQYSKHMSLVYGTSDYALQFLAATAGAPEIHKDSPTSISVASSTTIRRTMQLSGDNHHAAADDLNWTPSSSSSSSSALPEFPFPNATPHTTAVFYHIYIPPTAEGKQNSARIIQEQFQQLASASKEQYTVYYNTIGELSPGELGTEDIQSWCTSPTNIVACVSMQHYNDGMEDKTLQPLHDFCSLNQDDTPVIYLHNKGSYNHKPINEAWRYQMTQAVTSPQCQQAVGSSSSLAENNNDHQCNLCGLYFSVERGMFMAGNMWRSRCSYVRQLLPPSHDFPQAMHTVTAHALLERLRFKLLMTLQELRAGVFGIDRFATEFWVASHPTIRPCDFSKVQPPEPNKLDLTDQFLNWLRRMGDTPAVYQQALKEEWFAPQAPAFPLPLPPSLQVVKYPDVRLREYFLLAGNLFKWYFLYQQAPPADSWVYTWFPDGDEWRRAVQDHGAESVQVVTSRGLAEEVASGRNRYTRDNTKKKKSVVAPPPTGGALRTRKGASKLPGRRE